MIRGNKPKAATFRLVLKKLQAQPDWMYVCYVIENLSFINEISYEQASVCKDYIMKMLNGCHAYGVWLDVNHSRLVGKMSSKRYETALREGRIAWVKHIIQVLES